MPLKNISEILYPNGRNVCESIEGSFVYREFVIWICWWLITGESGEFTLLMYELVLYFLVQVLRDVRGLNFSFLQFARRLLSLGFQRMVKGWLYDHPALAQSSCICCPRWIAMLYCLPSSSDDIIARDVTHFQKMLGIFEAIISRTISVYLIGCSKSLTVHWSWVNVLGDNGVGS